MTPYMAERLKDSRAAMCVVDSNSITCRTSDIFRTYEQRDRRLMESLLQLLPVQGALQGQTRQLMGFMEVSNKTWAQTADQIVFDANSLIFDRAEEPYVPPVVLTDLSGGYGKSRCLIYATADIADATSVPRYLLALVNTGDGAQGDVEQSPLVAALQVRAAELFVERTLNPPANVKERYNWLASATADAQVGNLRAAYRSIFRGLDQLFLTANWSEVTAVLEEICSERYPTDLGIGIMRFASDAAPHIQKWNSILAKLKEMIDKNGGDAAKLLRGLIRDDAAIQGR